MSQCKTVTDGCIDGRVGFCVSSITREAVPRGSEMAQVDEDIIGVLVFSYCP